MIVTDNFIIRWLQVKYRNQITHRELPPDDKPEGRDPCRAGRMASIPPAKG